MRKILNLLLVFTLCFMLVGCGNEEKPQNNQDNGNNQVEQNNNGDEYQSYLGKYLLDTESHNWIELLPNQRFEAKFSQCSQMAEITGTFTIKGTMLTLIFKFYGDESKETFDIKSNTLTYTGNSLELYCSEYKTFKKEGEQNLSSKQDISNIFGIYVVKGYNCDSDSSMKTHIFENFTFGWYWEGKQIDPPNTLGTFYVSIYENGYITYIDSSGTSTPEKYPAPPTYPEGISIHFSKYVSPEHTGVFDSDTLTINRETLQPLTKCP